jgi:Synergist-CTERM protein sorting domain-containing protein
VKRTLFVLVAFLFLIILAPRPSEATVIYVNQAASGLDNGASWTNAYTDLQTALSEASSGDQIWVAQGTYKPTSGSDRTATFILKQGVSLYGGFDGRESALEDRDWVNNPVLLTGDLAGNDSGTLAWDEPTRQDNSLHVVFAGSGTTISDILDGFVISGGHDNAQWSGSAGLLLSGTLTVRNCTFRMNSTNYGAAIVLNNDSVIEDCLFENNYAAGGAALSTGANGIVKRCVFRGNEAFNYGGAIYNTGGSTTVSECFFEGNSSYNAPGIYAGYGGGITVINSVFSGNASGGGSGTIYVQTNVNLANCTFYGNTNTSSSGGAAIHVYGGNLVAKNCIFSENSENGASEDYNQLRYGYGSLTLSNCLFDTLSSYAYNNNVAGDPLFTDAAGSDFSLQPGSPAIDAGLSEGAPAIDIRGVARPQGAGIDIGAYEYMEEQGPDVDSSSGCNTGTLNPMFLLLLTPMGLLLRKSR